MATAGVSGCARGFSGDIHQGLQSENPSERVAAAVLAAKTGDCTALGLLVECLNDPAADVRFFAAQALERLTGETLGYEYYADADARFQAAQRWRQWVREHPSGKEGG